MSKPVKNPQEVRPYRILGFGDACIDLLIYVSEDFLTHIPGEKGGAEPIDRETLNQILAASETLPIFATGGSCANTIKGLAALNEKCAFLSVTGYDALGEHFSLNLKKWGVVRLFTQSQLSTTLVLCLITPDGQRTMRSCSDYSQEMTDDVLQDDSFKGIKLLHLDAYTLRRGQLTERAIQLAKSENAIRSIDLSSFEIVREFKERLLTLLPDITLVFANEKEAYALTGLEPVAGCFKMQEMCSIAVVLRGNKGCLVGHHGKIIESPAFATTVVDSTGASDLFASGFLYGFLQGLSLDKCATFGNRLGSAIIEVVGAELPAEKWKTLKEFIKNGCNTL